MGLGDFFKNIFGKKNCALCGKRMRHDAVVRKSRTRNFYVTIAEIYAQSTLG